MPTIYTFGHGTRTEDQMIECFDSEKIKNVVDIRSFPGSWKHPAARKENMVKWVPKAHMKYTWMKDLGGYRKNQAGADKETWWNNTSFRQYAAYTLTPEFHKALDALMKMALQKPTAYMCSESVWWRCHRRVVSDYLVLLHGWDVEHIMGPGKLQKHIPAAGARKRGDSLMYDKKSEASKPDDTTGGVTPHTI